MRSLILICGITLSISSNAQVEPVNSKENIDPSLGETNELIKSAKHLACSGDLELALARYEAVATIASLQDHITDEIVRIKKILKDQSQAKNEWVKNVPTECVDPNDKDLFKCTDLYFQFKGEPIHPSIIKDLGGWLSDAGQQIVSVNIYDSNDSNRYFGKVQYLRDNYIGYGYSHEEENGHCSESTYEYKHIGRSKSGIHVLLATDSFFNRGNNTRASSQLMFIRFFEDKRLVFFNGDSEVPKTHTRPRLLITNLGNMVLGDRWQGELHLKKNKLFIKGTTHEERIPVNTPEELEQLEQKIKPIVLDVDFKF